VLNKEGLKNTWFRPVHFKPFYGTFLTVPCQGVQVHFDPRTAENLIEINFRLMRALGAERILAAAPKRHAMFDKVCGTDEVRKVLSSGGDLDAEFAKWRAECDQFRKERAASLLY
jgi:uncharacterized protein YbbC (DUF1343 family)